MPSPSLISFAGTEPEDLTVHHQIEVSPLTGAAVVRLPFGLTRNRSDFTPRLALEYNSSAGNSPFGLGWSLGGLLTVNIDAGKLLPRYDSRDRYVFSAGGELVPAFRRDGAAWRRRAEERGEFWVQYFRGRVEGGHVRAEQWRAKSTGRVHWRTRDAQNTLTVYGADADGAGRIADPADAARTFAWLPEAQYDTNGNAIRFEYLPEDRRGLDASLSYERRGASAGLSQRYLKRVLYGNTRPLRVGDVVPDDNRWSFEVVFDYGDHDEAAPPGPDSVRPWALRPDPFSTCRPGFEVRTYRLCRRVLLFHRFEDEMGAAPVLVGAYRLEHDLDPAGSTLGAVHYTGFRRDPESGQVSQRPLPPLRFDYSAPAVGRGFEPAAAESAQNAPHGLDGPGYRWIDLYGEGLPGILTETSQAWYFKPNEGGGRFGPQRLVADRPSYRLGQCALSDFDNDGNTSLFVMHGREAGFYEYDRETDSWDGFRPFPSLPHLEAAGARAQWLDLNGDGRADLVLSDPERLTWYPSLGKEGFGAPVETRRPRAEAAAAPLAEDLALDFFFADMNGDGLPDQVCVRNGRVEYWPALGNGRFGDPVLMEGSPAFAPEWEFDARRVLLVDLDGSGAADLVYVGAGEVRCWTNAQGNRLVEGPRVGGLPYIDNLSGVRVLDFLGDGTPCLVWSSPLADRASPIQYLPLTGGVKPRLLLSVGNSMGREVRLTYSTSAAHYLRDKRAGRPWRTRLPTHPVVVDDLEVIDHIGGSRALTRYEYHDGHFDGRERTFRGFGLVDQFDTESQTGAAAAAGAPSASPSCLRTWFHLGRDTAGVPAESYRGDAKQAVLAAHDFEEPSELGAGEYEGGLRALSGQIIRQELFAVTAGGERAEHPFRVTQNSYGLRRLQPAHERHDASFTFFPRESLTYDYEERPADPRVGHALVFDVDDYGGAVRECTVSYARRTTSTPASAAQRRTTVGVRTSGHVNFDQPDRHELGVPVEGREFEIAGLTPDGDGVFAWGALNQVVALAIKAPLAHHEPFSGGAQARLVGWERTFYWDDDAGSALPPGAVGARTLLHHQESACFTPDFIAQTFGGRVGPDLPRTDGGYLERDGYWWRPGDTHHYHTAAGFFHLARVVRPDGAQTVFTYDAHTLALVEVHDALGNRTRAEIDYHLVAPRRIIDPNDNVAEVIYDPLGVAVVTTMRGQVLDAGGNAQAYGHEPLSAYTWRAGANFASVLADPDFYLQAAALYVHYEPDAWAAAAAPPRVVKLIREEFAHDGEGGGAAVGRAQVNVTHFDGFGRALQSKTRVEGGPALARDAQGGLVLDGGGRPVEGPPADRWLVAGHTVYNAKQQPFRQYEPFFSTTAAYEPEEALARFGVFIQSQYDAAGRLVREDFPDGTHARTEFAAWEVRRHDPNDTVLDSHYRARRVGLADAAAEKVALRKAEAHADTPVVCHLDPRGQEVKRVEVAPDGNHRVTETLLDFHEDVLEVTDPRRLTAFDYRLDMAGRALFSHSADAGDRWALPDIFDRPVHLWDSRGVHTLSRFDALDRPTSVFVEGALGLSHVTEQFVYGEDSSVAQARLRNARGRLVVHRDQAGTLTVRQYDPAGQVLRSERRLRHDYKTEPDWGDPGAESALDATVYATANSFDALGRVRRQSLPDGTSRRLDYLRGGGLERVRLSTADGALTDLVLFDGSDFNARGQRTRARLGNGVEITHTFGRETFRTDRITARLLPTSAGGPAATLQDIEYTYDPAGNITRSLDHAQQPARPGAYLRGLNVSAECEFTYDAFYQLTEAGGRVHQTLREHDYRPGLADPGAVKGTRHLHPNNGGAVERYTQKYEYDLAGNLRRVRHQSVSNSWSTELWSSPSSNRTLPAFDASGAPVADPESRFDANGNCVFLPHLRRLEWDYRNHVSRAVRIDRSAAGGTSDAEYYVYDGGRMRVRKVSERLAEGGQVEITETVYLDGCEIRRVRRGTNLLLERITSHVSDGTGRIALLHRWTRDTLARETDDVTRARVRYQLTNHLGSSQLELDERGAIINYEEYFPFGGTAFVAGDSVREINVKDYRFCGKERDEATGLYYFGHRYYASWIGRWMSPDPVGPEDGYNLYLYVFNNPVNLTDPDGLQTRRGQHSAASPVARRFITFEALQRAMPGADPSAGAMVGYARGAAQSFTQFRNVQELEAAVRRQPGGYIGVYDPNFQRIYERMRARGHDEAGSTRLAEVLIHLVGPPSSPAGQGSDPATGPPPAGTGTGSGGSQQPSGAEHGDPGHGAAQGAGGGDASSRGTSSSGDPEATQTHPGGGGGGSPSARAAPAGGTGSEGVGPGAGSAGAGRGGGGSAGTRPGQGTGTDAGPGRGSSGRGAGAGPGGRGARHSSPAQDAPPPGDGVPGGGGLPGGGSVPGVGSQPGAGAPVGAGGNGGAAPGNAPLPPSGGTTPAPPGQTINGNDPDGSLHGSPSGTRDARGRGGASGAGSGLGSGANPQGSPSGQRGGGSGSHPPRQQTVMDQVARVAGYSQLEFGGDNERGESGGIPGGRGSHNWGGWGQGIFAALAVADLILTVMSLGETAALKGALRAGLSSLRRALTAAAGLFTREGLRAVGTRIANSFGRRASSRMASGVQFIFRRGSRAARGRPISLRELKMLLGRARMGAERYHIVERSVEEAPEGAHNVYGWVTRLGTGAVPRAADGRPIINITRLGLSSTREAVITIGHEIKHILDPHASEAVAEAAGEAFYRTFMSRMRSLRR